MMKKLLLTSLATALISDPLSATPLHVHKDYVNYYAYSDLPGTNSGELWWNTETGTGVGDSGTSPVYRICLIFAFSTDDQFRLAATSPEARIFLNLPISDLENGGAPSGITLSLLAAGISLSGRSAHSNTWFPAPDLATHSQFVDPSLVGETQVLDVTDMLRPHLDRLAWDSPGITFGLYVPIPSDNNVRNTTRFDLEAMSLEIRDSAVILPQPRIGGAVYLEFDTEAGRTYSIETSDNMDSWGRLPSTIAGNGETKRYYFPVEARQSFYRVIIHQ